MRVQDKAKQDLLLGRGPTSKASSRVRAPSLMPAGSATSSLGSPVGSGVLPDASRTSSGANPMLSTVRLSFVMHGTARLRRARSGTWMCTASCQRRRNRRSGLCSPPCAHFRVLPSLCVLPAWVVAEASRTGVCTSLPCPQQTAQPESKPACLPPDKVQSMALTLGSRAGPAAELSSDTLASASTPAIPEEGAGSLSSPQPISQPAARCAWPCRQVTDTWMCSTTKPVVKGDDIPLTAAYWHAVVLLTSCAGIRAAAWSQSPAPS